MMSNCLNAHEIHTIILDQFDDHHQHQLSHHAQQHNSYDDHLDGKKLIKYEDVEDQLPRIQFFKKSLITSSTSPPLVHHHQQQQQQQQQHFRVIKDGRLLYDDDNGHHGNTSVTSSGIKGTHIDCSNEYAMRPPPNPPPKVKIISSNEEPTSSIPDLEFDGTTVLCRVCGDKASGFHYGVHSCEGCKGFFRRSIQQKIQYRPCTKNQQCSILRINRNRCQYCRLKKCIAVGMSRDAVRFGRVPKREKARILAAMQQSTQNRGQQRALATELDDQPRLLAAVLRAHMDTCEFTREKVNQMRQRARECPTYSMPTLACPLNPAPEIQSEQEFSQRFAHVIRGVIDFAGMIPGFQLLTQDDKFTLLKAGLFDALFVRLICMFDTNINSIICLNGQLMRRDSIQNGANARFLVDSTFNFAERINSMNLTDSEIGLFCAIVLITPDRPGLRNVELIERMYKKLKMCLHTVIQQNRPEKPEFMQELLNTMPDLRTLSTLHTEKLVVFRTEHKELLRQNMWSSVVHDMEGQQATTTSTATTTTTTPEQDHSAQIIDDIAKSPMSSVSSTESNDTGVGNMDYNNYRFVQQQQSSITSSAPLLAATLSGCTSYSPAAGVCPMRNHSTVTTATNSPAQQYIHHRTSNSSAEDDMQQPPPPQAAVHLVPNGLTITPVLRQMPPNVSSVRKLESPTDSGIESGNEKQTEQAAKMATPFSSGSSSCSSPRSSLDDGTSLMDHHAAMHHHFASQSRHAAGTIDDMPVLKRVLQAPPLYDTNSLMDEAYKPHKKFRAMRHRSGSEITTSSSKSDVSVSPSPPAHHPMEQQPQSQLHMHLTRPQQLQQQQQQQQHVAVSSLSSTHSVLAKSLMEEPRMTPEQMKRQDIIQNYICGKYNQRNNSAAAAAAAAGGVSTSTNNHYKAASPAQSLLSTVLQAPSMRLSPAPLCDTKKWHDNKYGIVITTTMANDGQHSSPPPPPSALSPQCNIAVKVAISTNDSNDKSVDGAGTQPLNLSKKTLMSPTQNTATSTTQQHVIIDDEKQQQQQVHKILLEA